MKILQYTPSKKQGNLLGFVRVEFSCIIEGHTYPMTFDVTIIRNSQNGHLFVGWPSKPFQTPEGTTKYAPILRWARGDLDFLQAELVRKFHEFVLNRQPVQGEPPSSSAPELPPVPDYAQIDLPF